MEVYSNAWFMHDYRGHYMLACSYTACLSDSNVPQLRLIVAPLMLLDWINPHTVTVFRQLLTVTGGKKYPKRLLSIFSLFLNQFSCSLKFLLQNFIPHQNLCTWQEIHLPVYLNMAEKPEVVITVQPVKISKSFQRLNGVFWPCPCRITMYLDWPTCWSVRKSNMAV